VNRYLNLTLSLGCRYVLAAVFLMAAVTKITDLSGFADEIVLHSDLAYYPATVVAAVLPWLELTCGVCLALGVAVREAALILSVLLLALLCYAVTHLGQADCHCFLFPTRTQESIWWPPLRNGLLLFCALWTCRRVPMRAKNARMPGTVEDSLSNIVPLGDKTASRFRFLGRADFKD
jgi:putative oxidoreductase